MFDFNDFSKREKILISIIGIMAIINCVLLYNTFVNKQSNLESDIAFKLDEGTSIPVSGAIESEKPQDIVIYITGAVKAPGVYTLEEGKRIKDAIDIAGGYLDDADLLHINLAQKLEDEDKLYIPKVGEVLDENMDSLSTVSGGTSDKNDKININKASLEELDTLPGIGAVTAQKIIDHRTQNGPFKTIEDIKNVSGIGDKKFEQLKDKIRVK